MWNFSQGVYTRAERSITRQLRRVLNRRIEPSFFFIGIAFPNWCGRLYFVFVVSFESEREGTAPWCMENLCIIQLGSIARVNNSGVALDRELRVIIFYIRFRSDERVLGIYLQ